VSSRDRKIPDAALAAEKSGSIKATSHSEGESSSGRMEPRTPDAELAAENSRLSRENAALHEAVTARDRFLSVAAHELRNPMTPIRGCVQLLRQMLRRGAGDGALASKMEQGLEQVEWLIEQYVKRATTLLDVSRATTGKLHLDAVAVDLCALVREIEQSFAPIAEHAGSALEVQVPADPVLCYGDRLALEQIIDNLVSNALKYGGGNPVVVSVAVERNPDGKADACIVRVRDQGAGISPQDQSRIFARFERAVHPGEHAGGFGVGL
jgi:two-component system OmpR family sensor kinase